MTLLETANNAFLAMIAAPEAIRENREWLREFYDMVKARERIADLEHNLEVAEASNASLTELVGRLETELATLREKHDRLAFTVPEREEVMGKGASDSITDPGDGYELCKRELATEYRCTHWTKSLWLPVGICWRQLPSVEYAFRRPIAKPEPQWVACTASEARYLVCESDDANDVECSETDGRWCDAERWDKFPVELAYRTTSTLPEWLELLPDDFDRVRRIDGVEVRIPVSTRAYEVRRASVPVGTVLG